MIMPLCNKVQLVENKYKRTNMLLSTYNLSHKKITSLVIKSKWWKDECKKKNECVKYVEFKTRILLRLKDCPRRRIA